MTMTAPMSARVAADVLAVQCVLDSGVPHKDVGVWQRVREERLIALVHGLTVGLDPVTVLHAVDAIDCRLEAGEARTADDVMRIAGEALSAQRAL